MDLAGLFAAVAIVACLFFGAALMALAVIWLLHPDVRGVVKRLRCRHCACVFRVKVRPGQEYVSEQCPRCDRWMGADLKWPPASPSRPPC